MWIYKRKYNYKKGIGNSLIKINKHNELTTYLDLIKQRYKCRICNRKFYATTTEVDYKCYISKQVKFAILNCAKEMMVKSLIAYKDILPKVICIDEFTFKKKIYAFNICNAKILI